jgi:hypothetical protein
MSPETEQETKQHQAEAADYNEAETEIGSHQIEAEQIKTLAQADRHIDVIKDEIVKRSRLLDRTEQAKKDVMGGWRDVIKYQKEQLKESMERLGAVEDRRRILAAGNGE